MESEIAKFENKVMVFAEEIRARTCGMCNVGPGPFGFGVCNTNPSRIGMVIRIAPDPYSHSFPRSVENTMHTVTIEAYCKGKDRNESITMEQVKQFRQNYDSATRTIAKAILTLSEHPIQVSTEECDEAFGMMVDQEMASPGSHLTQTEARRLCKLKWYRGKTPKEIVSFQLFQPHICMPFRKYRRAVEMVLRRPVEMGEFKNVDLLREEYWTKCLMPQAKSIDKRKKNQSRPER